MNFHGGNIYSYKNDRLIDFSSNINPLGVPKSFEIKLVQNISDFTRYPDIQYLELRAAIAKYLKIDNVESIIVGNGAVEIIYKTISVLDVEKVVIVVPTFSEYKRAAEIEKIPVEEVNAYLENGCLDLTCLHRSISENSLMVLCNPNNPTGTLTNLDSMMDLALTLKAKNSYLLVDEAFIEFTEGYPRNSMIYQIDKLPNVIVVRAVTKFFGMPGIRLGYTVINDGDLAKKISNKMEPWNINTAAVIAGLSVLDDQAYIIESNQWIARERRYLYDELKEIPGLNVLPTQANFILLKSDKLSAKEIKKWLLERDVLIRTPEGFTGLTPYHFRIAIKDRKANSKLAGLLKELFI
ncbi:aminotransferase class I/II-fold pyridoxal phosphate-dependent enzyme [Alkalicella caledoniensis]|uniref:Aminotransferase class I/II-fold pyridoxal phosphate-dependent enzyme n=1 Tax=Alkalicella caledoniensis TaxID=2731377 RepID=A0A7G9W5A3_ALKCA|nr:threonine-phosphate decarboxylase [Alkalicella caledoniensis]QNO13865.1 aminotransferase class I/II-fold pyridoxal phosphate-dependent enzyme [Alkalicella caledoniensis]